MKIIENEMTVAVDIDDTIVMHIDEDTNGPGKIEFNFYGIKKYLYPHKEHIELVKGFHARGFYIEVHSGNGYQWAAHVIETLKLEKYIDIVKTKYIKLVDDQPVETWAGQRVYLPFRK